MEVAENNAVPANYTAFFSMVKNFDDRGVLDFFEDSDLPLKDVKRVLPAGQKLIADDFDRNLLTGIVQVAP